MAPETLFSSTTYCIYLEKYNKLQTGLPPLSDFLRDLANRQEHVISILPHLSAPAMQYLGTLERDAGFLIFTHAGGSPKPLPNPQYPRWECVDSRHTSRAYYLHFQLSLEYEIPQVGNFLVKLALNHECVIAITTNIRLPNFGFLTVPKTTKLGILTQTSRTEDI